LTEFFEGAVGSGTFAPRRKVTHKSKRMTKAMANLRRTAQSDDDVQEISPRKMTTKRRRPAQEIVKVESESDERMKQTSNDEESSSEDDNYERRSGVAPEKPVQKVAPNRSGGRKRLKA